MWKGIDVSDNQGVIDWAKVKSAGVQFAILRSVRGSGKADYQFAANLVGCRAQKIPVAVYKYTYATTTAQAQEEARQVVTLLQSYGLQGTMAWWDVENEILKTIGKAGLTACVKAAQAVIEAAGYRFGLYVGQNVYKEQWLDFDQFAANPLWVARYYKGYNVMQFADNPDQNYIPVNDRAIWGWQYTSTGRVPGISGNVDLDICYQDPAEAEAPATEPGTFWCLSIADVGTEAVAQAVAAAYPGCLVHRASILDVGGITIWIASIADVWTQAQAEEAQRQFAAIKIAGLVHQIRIVA